MNYLSIVSTLVTFVFAGAVFRRYQQKGGTHLMMWTVGLFFYGIGTLTEVILSFSFNGLVLKLWYLCGAMLTAAWLGQGTMYLLIRRARLVNGFAIGLALVSVLSLLLMVFSPLKDGAIYNPAVSASAQYRNILARSGGITALTIILNMYGTILLVGGAIYSAYLFWRKQVLINRVMGNILIAAGALSPALAGTFIKAGLADLLYPSELLGVIVMYIGFQLAVAYRPVTNETTAVSTQ